MARRRPFEDAPPAVSSSEDEEETDDEEETPKSAVQAQHNGTGEKQNDNENGSEDEEDDDDDEEEKEKPNLPPSKPSKPDSESDSETDSEDTESTQPPSPSLSDFTIKPISPKRKPGPKLEQPNKENDGEGKKAKRGAGAGGGGSQRLWSDEDEIVMLNGMVEYQSEKGKSPFADNGDFHGFVKESLHVDATISQFLDKIRRLKKKYFTDVDKNEKEIDEIFSKPHDLECVELAKKIWGDEMNGGGMELSVKKRNAVANEELDKEEAGSEDLWDKYPYLRSSLDGENLSGDVKERTMLMLGMAEEEKLAELEREWRSLMKAKLEFIVMQKDLIAKQIKLSLDAMNSHGS